MRIRQLIYSVKKLKVSVGWKWVSWDLLSVADTNKHLEFPFFFCMICGGVFAHIWNWKRISGKVEVDNKKYKQFWFNLPAPSHSNTFLSGFLFGSLSLYSCSVRDFRRWYNIQTCSFSVLGCISKHESLGSFCVSSVSKDQWKRVL